LFNEKGHKMGEQEKAPGRSYELTPVHDGWTLKLYEDGEEMGGGFGLNEDYDLLLDAAEQFCGN
jgi:hypothetical protein